MVQAHPVFTERSEVNLIIKIHEYFLEDAETPDIEAAMEEFDGDYEEEELRLYRIKFFSDVAN